MCKYKVISWNVNGIRAIHRKHGLNILEKESPDIFCVQETKAHEDQLSFDIKMIGDYQSYFCDAERKGYSGVGTYSKIKPKLIKLGMGIEEFDNEGRVIETEFENFTLLNVYFPNGKASKIRLDYKMKFYEAFLQHILKLRNDGKKVIFCGDVNTAHKVIDLSRPKANEKISGFLEIERDWIDKVIKNGFIDSFRKFDKNVENYTWWSMRTGARERNVGWRIDYFFVDKSLDKHLISATIYKDIMGSDHCPISIELEF
jgi:exodeoxyribonuclease III